MTDLPLTDKMQPRPVYRRYLMRRHSMKLEPPSEAEKRDAIRILADPYLWADEISDEAFRILDEAGKNHSADEV